MEALKQSMRFDAETTNYRRSIMKKKWLIAATLLLTLALTALAVTGFDGVRWSTPTPAASLISASITPTDLVEQGKQALYAHKILLAKEKFLAAATADPTDQQAQLFLGVVRVAALYEDVQTANTPALDSIKEIANQFGITFTSFSIYNTQATSSNQLPSTAPRTGKVFDFVATKMLPELNEALQNFEHVTNTDFSSTLQSSALAKSGNTYTIDYADVLTIKTLAYAAKATLELMLAYNWDVHIPSLISANPQDLQDFRKLLVANPMFATPKQPARLSTAKAALHSFILTFNQASDQINLRSVQNGHLFVFDAPVTEEQASLTTTELANFKSTLADIDASLYGPHLYSFVKGDTPTVDLSKLFDSTNPINIRNTIIDLGNNHVFPDRTFGNIIPAGIVSQNLDKISTDIEWELTWKRTSNKSGLADIAYNGSLYVSVGVEYSQSHGFYFPQGIISTSHDGIAWARQSPIQNGMFKRVKWVGGKCVVIGTDANTQSPGGVFGISPNGINSWNWTTDNFQGTLYTDVAWGNNTFVRVGPRIETSPDGLNWFYQYSPADSISSITWAGDRFVAIGTTYSSNSNQNETIVLTSINGSVWSTKNLGSYGMFSDFSDLTWINNQFVAVGSTYNAMMQPESIIISSPDGINWTRQAVGTTASLRRVAWGGGQFMAVGSNSMLTSTDGATWAQHNFLINDSFEGVTYGNGRFTVVGNSGIHTQTGAPVTNITSYLVTTNISGAGGSITPSIKIVKNGATTSFAIKHDYGYNVVASGCGGTLTGTVYKTGPITEDCTVTATLTPGDMALTISTKPLLIPLSYVGKTGALTLAVTGVTNQEELATTISSSDPWITAGLLTYNARGNGSLKFTISPNLSSQPRQGSITIAGQSYAISQAGKPCKLTLVPSTILPLPASGGSMSLSVAIEPVDGSWSVTKVAWLPTTTPGWLEGLPVVAQTGSASLPLTVLENISGKPRSVVLTFKSSDLKSTKTVTVRQAAK
jgi:hypothetical protein